MRNYFLTLALTLLASSESGVTADGSSSISYYNINYRQEQPVAPVSTSISSYDYWWPYPPGGVAVTSAVLPTLSFSLPTTTTTSNNIISTTTDEDTSLTTSSIESSISTSAPTSSTSSTTIYHITALPPANTSTPNTIVRKRKPPSTEAFKFTYVEPMLVILGITLGSAIAWFCCGCLSARRGPRERASSLEPGPAYVATQTEIEDDELKYKRGDRDMEAVPAGRESPSKRALSYSNSHRSRLWLTRAMSTHSSDPVQGEKVFSWPEPAPRYDHEEDDPFLAVPTQARSTAGKSNCSSPDPLAQDEDEELVPYDSLRHKSIRRGILERLKFGTLRRPQLDMPVPRRVSYRRGHSREESDVRVNEVKLPERTYSRKDETEWVAGSGFRIVEEDLEAIREKVRVGDWGDEEGKGDGYSNMQRSPAKEREITLDDEDKYTALPVRKSPSKKGTRGVPRVDSALLPVSPRQITSPPLESRLCFTPRVGGM